MSFKVKKLGWSGALTAENTALFKVRNDLYFYIFVDDSHAKVPIETESFFYGNALIDPFDITGGTNSFMKLHQ